MKKTIIKIAETEYTFTGDISLIIGRSTVRILEFKEDGKSKQTDIAKNFDDIVTVNNWKEDN